MSAKNKKTTGYVHVYTGNGKGKTTAALGLTLRALGAGKRIFIGQFAKGMKYSELKVLTKLAPSVVVEQFGLRCFIRSKPSLKDINAARQGLARIRDIFKRDSFDVVVLDEANIATFFKLFSPLELLDVIQSRPSHVEVVITGRYADNKILRFADLITEMKEVRHYYIKGVRARPGIEC